MRASIVMVLTIAAFAQEAAVFRTTTQLIQVDVAAEDKDGHPVADLTKGDLELRVSGKVHPIDAFTVMRSVPVFVEPLPKGTFTNRPALDASQGRFTTFLLDLRNTNFSLQAIAIQQLQKLLETTPPEGRTALYLIHNGFQIVQEFTADRELLKEKAAALEAVIPPPVNDLQQAEAASNETVAAFRDIAKHLAGISGQKVLVWVTTGFPDNEPAPPPPPGSLVPLTPVRTPPAPSFLADIDDVVRALGNANIVVEAAESAWRGATVSPENGPVVSYVNPLQMIAERTGGRFFPAEADDLGATLQRAATDRAASYEIGFYDDGARSPGLVPIEIRSKRPGVTLRHREGFYAGPAPKSVTAQDILERAADAMKIPLTARVTKTAGNRGNYTLRLNVDAHSLTLRQEGKVWRTKPTFFTRFASKGEDQVGDVPLDSPELTLTQAQHDRALREGINLRFTVKALEGALSLRVLVRDESSGDTGTVTIPLADVPEAY